MSEKTAKQILQDRLRKLELKREDLINKHIIPIEIKMAEIREKIEAMDNLKDIMK